MRRKYFHLRVILYLALFVALVLQASHAAKLKVIWVAPTQNSDGSKLTDLTGYRIDWGSCNPDGSVLFYQAGINVAATATSSWIYPTGLSSVCVRIFAINSANSLSNPAYASGPTPPLLSQPTH